MKRTDAWMPLNISAYLGNSSKGAKAVSDWLNNLPVHGP